MSAGSSLLAPSTQLRVLRTYCASASGRMQLKFVIAGERDLDEALACVVALEDELPPATPVILQPESATAGRGARYLSFLSGLAQQVLHAPAWQRFAPRIEKEVQHQTISNAPIRLIPGQEGYLARLRGTVALVLYKHFGISLPA